MRNRQHLEPTLSSILEDLKARDRALLTIRQAAAFLGMAEKTMRNRLSDGSFPLRPVRWPRIAGSRK
jgi:hypothetical protein